MARYRAVAGGYIAWGFMFWAFLYWLPSYLSTVYHLSLKQAGAFAIAPWAAGVVAALLGSVLVDRLYRPATGASEAASR